jgi:protein-disulfide isomerase
MDTRRSIQRVVIICLVVLLSNGYSEPKGSVTDSAIRVLESNTIEDFDLRVPTFYSIGSDDAPLVLLEFADYQCNHCSVFHEVLFPKLKSEYIDTGKIFYVALNYPNENHKVSGLAAEAAYCAGAQGRFWEMRDLLFENSLFLTEERITELAQELGLDMAAFDDCLQAGTYTDLVAAEKNCGNSLGIKGTPSFILAEKGDNSAINGKLVKGVLRWSKFNKPIAEMLNPASEKR